MSSRSENITRLDLYNELDEIVSAMKNLAQVELHRILRAQPLQHAALATCRSALTASAPQTGLHAPAILLAIGSQRGFCGGFNEQIVRLLPAAPARVLLVGSRLAARVTQGMPGTEVFNGPATADEILPCAQQLAEVIGSGVLPPINLLAHAENGPQLVPLWPPLISPAKPAPRTYLPAATLQRGLAQHYLLHAIGHALLLSLQAENRQRLQQMDAARDHLSQLSQQLLRHMNVLRQQQIVDEIEVILAGQDGAYN